MAHAPHTTPENGRGYETRDADAKTMFTLGGGLIVLILVFLGIVLGLLKLFEQHPPVPAERPRAVVAETGVIPPEPRLQASPQRDLERMRAVEDSLLRSYGWVDRKAGIVRIPIDTAMAMLEAEQLPVRPVPESAAGGNQATNRTPR